jgi:hypothetical protein
MSAFRLIRARRFRCGSARGDQDTSQACARCLRELAQWRRQQPRMSDQVHWTFTFVGRTSAPLVGRAPEHPRFSGAVCSVPRRAWASPTSVCTVRVRHGGSSLPWREMP